MVGGGDVVVVVVGGWLVVVVMWWWWWGGVGGWGGCGCGVGAVGLGVGVGGWGVGAVGLGVGGGGGGVAQRHWVCGVFAVSFPYLWPGRLEGRTMVRGFIVSKKGRPPSWRPFLRPYRLALVAWLLPVVSEQCAERNWRPS